MNKLNNPMNLQRRPNRNVISPNGQKKSEPPKKKRRRQGKNFSRQI